MASAKNEVVAGDFIGCSVIKGSFGCPATICAGLKTIKNLDKTSIQQYEIVNNERRKSATSAVGRGIVGGALLGPVGLLAGLSAKSKDIYHIAIYFKDGKKSLVEVDGKIYKCIIEKCF